MVESAVRVLNIVFWVAAVLLVASLVLFNAQVVNAVLMVVVVVCSGALAWYEFRLRACADRLATFRICRFSERSNRLLIAN